MSLKINSAAPPPLDSRGRIIMIVIISKPYLGRGEPYIPCCKERAIHLFPVTSAQPPRGVLHDTGARRTRGSPMHTRFLALETVTKPVPHFLPVPVYLLIIIYLLFYHVQLLLCLGVQGSCFGMGSHSFLGFFSPGHHVLSSQKPILWVCSKPESPAVSALTPVTCDPPEAHYTESR